MERVLRTAGSADRHSNRVDATSRCPQHSVSLVFWSYADEQRPPVGPSKYACGRSLAGEVDDVGELAAP
jgi:hypothetical protein